MSRHKLLGVVAVLTLLFSGIASADTNDTHLVENITWAVDGATNTGPNPQNIVVSIDNKPAGVFSELKVFYSVPAVGLAQIFSVKGNGTLQPSLPPPGEVGGAFALASYWDCAQGFIPPASIVAVNLKSRNGKNAPLLMRGRISNLNSMEAKDFLVKIFPARTNSVRADVSYRLMATRDFCVDHTRHVQQDEFRPVMIIANYFAPDVYDNDTARFIRLLERICGPFGICHSRSASYCAALTNATGYVFTNSYRLGGQRIFLVHSQAQPHNTPTLAVAFRAPAPSRFNAQGSVIATNDPAAANVNLWGNWWSVKGTYRAKRLVGRFRYSLEATPPKALSCDRQE